MLAIEWGDLTHAGAFFLGVLTGIVVTVRLTKVLAEFLREERDRE